MSRLAAVTFLAVAVLMVGGGAADAQASVSASQLLSDEGQFMCVSCHEALNQVYSAEAQDEKLTLQQLLDQGLSMSQVKSEMVADYGKGVLAKPSDPWVYAIPIALVLAGVGFLFWALPRWRERSRTRPAAGQAGGPDPIAAPSDAEQDRLNAELEAF